MTTAFSLTPTWSQSNRFDVAEDCELIISNTGGFDIRWVRNADTATPTSHPAIAHLIRPGQSVTTTASADDYIWLAALPSGTALIDKFS